MSATPRSTFTKNLPRALAASVGVMGLLAVSACATEEESQETATAAETAGETAGDSATEETTAEESAEESTEESAAGEPALSATINNADGAELGTVDISEVDNALEFSADFTGMEPGFYGFHIHQIGECEPDSAAPDDPEDTGDFMSAGGHIGSDESDHPDHPGDLPQLLVNDSGDATMTVQTDRLTLADLEDDDGSAIMVHTDPDNYANVPERYAAEGPDEDTLSTGDAGSRLGCGVAS